MTNAVPHQGLFELSEPPFLVAKEVWLRGEKYISVYRSVSVGDTDSMYRPVADTLRGAELVAQETVEDETMIFGRAEWLLYRL